MRGEKGERLAVVWRALVVAAVLGAPVAARAATGDEAGFDAAALAGLEAELGGIVEASEVPGAAVALVRRDGEAWTRGFGTADLSTGLPVTPETLFRTNSVSKSLVALAVLRLVEEGRLALDDHLRRSPTRSSSVPPAASSAPPRTCRSSSVACSAAARRW